MPKGNDFPGLLRGVMLAHLILLLHVLLAAAIVLLVILSHGVMAYMPLILIAGLTVLGGLVFYLSRRLKAEGKGLREILNSPIFSGKSVEISLMGGVASIKIDSRNGDHAPAVVKAAEHAPLPEDRKPARKRTLTELARLLENKQFPSNVNDQDKRELFN